MGLFRNLGQAVVNSISDTGTVINNAPVCELNRTVTIPGRALVPLGWPGAAVGGEG
jgi:hypothetical protein